MCISKKLETDDTEALKVALDLLTKQLQEIRRAVPQTAVTELQKVTLWFSPEYPGVPPRAEYHPGAGWLRDHGRDPAMVKGLEFTNVRIFAAETRRMPNFALHELAHAYHDQVLGNSNQEVLAAFERAKATGRYVRVERQDSEGRKTKDRAYALTSPQEYFAETTEAYFAKNDFQPFDREELKAFDRAAFELLGALWKCDQQQLSTLQAIQPQWKFPRRHSLLRASYEAHELVCEGGTNGWTPTLPCAQTAHIRHVG